MRRILTLAIVTSWAVLMALLVEKQARPPVADVGALPGPAPRTATSGSMSNATGRRWATPTA
jgi:hypothetical protein